jgi:antitoxin HicB
MLQSYPVILTKDENGTVIAQFPDVPEAMTVGADETNALDWAQDALVVALTGYIEERRDIPPPSKLKKGQKTAKFAVYWTSIIIPAFLSSFAP